MEPSVYNQSHSMSEFVLEDDPEHLRGTRYEFIQKSIIEPSRFTDYESAAVYRREQEKRDIPALSLFADKLLQMSDPTANAFDDQTIYHQGAVLHRHVEERIFHGVRVSAKKHYFFKAIIDEQEYCRVWMDTSEHVNWCYNEQRHEPAADVQKNLETAFLPLAMNGSYQLGRITLSSLLRQKA